MTVLVLIPIFEYINCVKIWLVLNSYLHIMHMSLMGLLSYLKCNIFRSFFLPPPVWLLQVKLSSCGRSISEHIATMERIHVVGVN